MSKLDHAASLISSDAAAKQKATLQQRTTNRKSINSGYNVSFLRRKVASTTHSRNSGSTWRWFSETGGVMLYIMMRTQLYLDEDIWNALHIQSRQRRTPISELVRMAVRDRYGASQTNRRQAMKPIIS
jgi:hypothetical protein